MIIKQFFRYSLVGASGVVVNGAFYFGSMTFLNFHHSYAWAAGIGVAWITNFLLNKFWTFNDGNA